MNHLLCTSAITHPIICASPFANLKTATTTTRTKTNTISECIRFHVNFPLRRSLFLFNLIVPQRAGRTTKERKKGRRMNERRTPPTSRLNGTFFTSLRSTIGENFIAFDSNSSVPSQPPRRLPFASAELRGGFTCL